MTSDAKSSFYDVDGRSPSILGTIPKLNFDEEINIPKFIYDEKV